MQWITAAARAAGADALMCTEKDIFNLPGIPAEGLDLYYCRIHLHVARETEFWSDVLAIAAKPRTR
jgi:hypothetical protein